MRLCSLVPGATEVIAALDLADRLVAVSHECDYPDSIRHVPSVVESVIDQNNLSSEAIDRAVKQLVSTGRRLYRLNEQRLIEAQPDVILAQDLCHVCAVTPDQLAQAIKALDSTPRLVTLNPTSLESVLLDVERIAQALGIADQEVSKSAENGRKVGQAAVSPLNGAPVPSGRPKGVKNRLTNLRDAVLEAFDTVGGPAYLVQLAQGTQSDRAAFVGLVSKVLPTQVQAQVEGGVQIQLSWLGQRSIGTTVAQEPEQITQVVDLQRDPAGKYRIIDPAPAPAGADGQAAATDEKAVGGPDGR